MTTLIPWIPSLIGAAGVLIAAHLIRAALFGVRPFDVSRPRRYLWLAASILLADAISGQLASLGLVYWPVGVVTWAYFFILSRHAESERGGFTGPTADEEV